MRLLSRARFPCRRSRRRRRRCRRSRLRRPPHRGLMSTPAVYDMPATAPMEVASTIFI